MGRPQVSEGKEPGARERLLEATAQIMEEEGLVENAASMGQRLQDGLRTLLSEDGVGEVRGIGLIAGVELVDDKEKHKPFPVELGVGPRVVAEDFTSYFFLTSWPGRIAATS